jgi:hypothetical protein
MCNHLSHTSAKIGGIPVASGFSAENAVVRAAPPSAAIAVARGQPVAADGGAAGRGTDPKVAPAMRFAGDARSGAAGAGALPV